MTKMYLTKEELLKEAVELSLVDWHEAEDEYAEYPSGHNRRIMTECEAAHKQAVRALQAYEAGM